MPVPAFPTDLGVVHFVPSIFGANGTWGGAERYAYELAKAMAEQVPTTLVAFGRRAERYRDRDLDVIVLEGRAIRGQAHNPWSSRILPLALRARVAHTHQNHTVMSTAVATVRRLRGLPTFTSDLGGGGWDLSGYVDTGALYAAHLHISRFSCSLASEKERVRSQVIYGGIDLSRFHPTAADVGRQPRAVYVGRLLPHKGVDVLIESLPDSLELLVIGREAQGRYWQDLQDLARGKRVTFVRNASDEEIIEAYQTSSCVVLPSVHYDRYGVHAPAPELLGQTALEGMACGAAAIVSDAASLPEIVEPGVTGLIVPQGDRNALRSALERLADPEGDSRTMGRAARVFVEQRFTWPKVVDRCLAAYAHYARFTEVGTRTNPPQQSSLS